MNYTNSVTELGFTLLSLGPVTYMAKLQMTYHTNFDMLVPLATQCH